MRSSIGAGLLVGALGIAGIAVFQPRRGPAAVAFVEAWRHSLTGTYVMVDRIERRLVNGRTLVSEVRTAQRPPDRLRSGAGTLDGRINGRRIGCAKAPGSTLRCRDGGPAPPYQREVNDEVARLRALVTGNARAYDAHRAGAGCFRLRLRARVLAPPYGEDATFCFDEATGAPLRSVVRRSQGADVHRTTILRARVTDADLRPPTRAA